MTSSYTKKTMVEGRAKEGGGGEGKKGKKHNKAGK